MLGLGVFLLGWQAFRKLALRSSAISGQTDARRQEQQRQGSPADDEQSALRVAQAELVEKVRHGCCSSSTLTYTTNDN